MADENAVGGKEGKLGPAAFLTLQDSVNLSYRVDEGIQSSFEEIKFYLQYLQVLDICWGQKCHLNQISSTGRQTVQTFSRITAMFQ